MNGNYIDIDFIFEKINNSKIPGTNYNTEEIVEWVYEILIKIGNIHSFEKVIEKLFITDNKAKLPISLIEINQIVSDENIELTKSYNGFDLIKKTDYVLNKGYLYIIIDTEFVNVNYNRLIIDDNDNPLIPDEINIIDAVIAYIQHKMAERAFFQGKLDERKKALISQDYYFKIKKAQSSPKMSILKDSKRFSKIVNRNFF